jgi:hypothetical protein
MSRVRVDRVVTVRRLILASASTIFDILADPTKHPQIDGSDTVHGLRGAPNEPPTRLHEDAKFVMRMRIRPLNIHPAALVQVVVALVNGGKLTNQVVAFEEGRQIAWRNFGRHVWRWELKPEGARSTLVTETFDYSTNLMPWLLETARFPRRNATAMNATLRKLAELVER